MNYYDCISKLRPEAKPDDPAPLIEWNISQLVKAALSDGEESVETTNLLITENMRLIGAAISKFMALHPDAEYLIDDLFSEGLLALTKAVQTLVRNYKDNPEKVQDCLDTCESVETGYNFLGYIYVAIYRAIQYFYEIDSSNPISARMRERHTPPGMDTPTRKIDLSSEFFLLQTEDTFSEVYIMEDITGACNNQVELDIVKLKLSGKNLEDIGELLGIGESAAWRCRKELYQRYCKQQGISE